MVEPSYLLKFPLLKLKLAPEDKVSFNGTC